MKIFMRTNIKLLALSFLIMLISCAAPNTSSEQDQKYLFPELEEVTSIRNYSIDSWSEVDKQSLIISVSPTQAYLVILRNRNHDLKFAHAISFGNSRRVYSKFDRIQIINTSQDIEHSPAYIERIYKLKDKEQVKRIKQKIRNQNK